ncbi:GNAT family N-acetyltransferase [Clostridium tertium]|uniref:Acetyltransferase (GNAT) family protein n=1 Tax=Clostridium tertium TaxID=1559 RepID=A0A6N2ZTD3_9CLOT
MNFRKTTEKDLDSVIKIIDEAKEFLKINNIDQWQNGYPNKEVILRDIENDHSYVLDDNGEIIATTVLSFDGDKNYDVIYNGDWITDNKYGVIHRIAVSRDYANRGIGKKIIESSEDIAKENNIKSMRADTHKDNKTMQSLLLKNGYEYCGIIFVEDGTERLAFEKEL